MSGMIMMDCELTVSRIRVCDPRGVEERGCRTDAVRGFDRLLALGQERYRTGKDCWYRRYRWTRS
jgi:hypothetical protein